MKRKVGLAILISLLIICVLSYNNCGNVLFIGHSYETSIGNPMNPTQASPEILFAICSVLDRCRAQVPFNVCMSGVQSTNGIGAQLGLPPGVDDPYSALESAESSGVIAANLTTANICVDTINNLSCTNPNVQNAYNPLNSNPFAAVPYMVPTTSCGQVFTPPVQTYACSTKVFLRGISNAPNGPTITGSGISYSVNPSLPTGLSFNPNTGVISGTPTVVTGMTAYKVTATNSIGAANTTINIMTADGYLVNDLTDLPYAGPNCNSTGGTCTLRAAVGAVATNSGTPNVILLPAGQVTLTLGTSLPVSYGMSIYGDCAQGTTVDGNNAIAGVMTLSAGPTTLANLTIQHGLITAGGTSGAGVFITAAASTYTTTIQNLTIQSNNITGGFGDGAGIAAGGTNSGIQAIVNISNTNIINNVSSQPGGGVGANSFSQWTITNSNISNNTAFYGGAIANAFGATTTLTIAQSLFYNNVGGNISGGYGGAIYDGSGTGSYTYINDSFISNLAQRGAAIYTGGSSHNITNSSFINNSAFSGHPTVADSGPGIVTLTNSLFENNLSSGILLNCLGPVTSNGYNLSDDGQSDCNLTGPGDLFSTAALLSPLQNNGGFTQTMGLLPGSPGIDQANSATCPATDQRSYPRLINGKCDIGAFESSP